MKIEGHLYQRHKDGEWIIQLEIPVWLADKLNGKTFYVNRYTAPLFSEQPKEVSEAVVELSTQKSLSVEETSEQAGG